MRYGQTFRIRFTPNPGGGPVPGHPGTEDRETLLQDHAMRSSGIQNGGIYASILLGLLFGFAPARWAVGGEGDALLEALKKAVDAGGTVDAVVQKMVPAVKGAGDEAREAAKEELREAYERAGMAMNDEEAAKTARRISILALAAKAAEALMLYEGTRMILWEEMFEVARGSSVERAQKMKEAVKRAKWWEPLWENVFDGVLEQCREAKGDENSEYYDQYLEQLEIMAEAAKRALGREDLQKKLEVFKKGGKKWT
ncbi:MAG: hypothetical protein ACYTHM_13690, partial [Planctomycetota bacterium]